MPSCDLFAPPQDGLTPLHYAAAGGHLECVLLLLAADADKDALGKARGRPRDVTPAMSDVHPLSTLPNPTSTRALSTECCPPTASSAQTGASPLHLAASGAHSDCLDALLQAGADANPGRVPGVSWPQVRGAASRQACAEPEHAAHSRAPESHCLSLPRAHTRRRQPRRSSARRSVAVQSVSASSSTPMQTSRQKQ